MQKKWIITTAIVAIVAAGAILSAIMFAERSWVSFLEGDPKRGGKVFFNKGCTHCHAISGTGGTAAADLGSIPQAGPSLAQFVGSMWNHGPEMWETMEEDDLRFPEITERDMVDVVAYLLNIRYFSESGNLEKGKQLLTQKGCDQCHSLHGEADKVGPDLRQWGANDHPILWACAMWNHAPLMAEMMQEEEISWPEFQGNDMVDLLYYIRSVSYEPRKSVRNLFPADPAKGKDLFSKKGCFSCHAIHGKGGTIGSDFGEPTPHSRTPTQFAGSMWNHSPQMWETMQEKKVERPQFSEKELADLFAYLYTVQYFDEPGDTVAGEALFVSKQCALCHKEGENGVPKLSRWRGHLSPVTMAYVMWHHGPKMYAKMKAMDIPWPTFKEREMVDLIAYLNSGSRQGQ